MPLHHWQLKVEGPGEVFKFFLNAFRTNADYKLEGPASEDSPAAPARPGPQCSEADIMMGKYRSGSSCDVTAFYRRQSQSQGRGDEMPGNTGGLGKSWMGRTEARRRARQGSGERPMLRACDSGAAGGSARRRLVTEGQLEAVWRGTEDLCQWVCRNNNAAAFRWRV
jgi:hypothetical protein